MTIKARTKPCKTCGIEFKESKSDSNKQWLMRGYCSMSCNSKSSDRRTDIFERLERFQVKNDTGCWGWIGNKDAKGYGTLSNRKGSKFSPEKAHRVSYEKVYGKIEDGLFVLHKCDNPECTNPSHLFSGTQKDNMQDCSKKNRLNPKSLLNLRSNKIAISK